MNGLSKYKSNRFWVYWFTSDYTVQELNYLNKFSDSISLSANKYMWIINIIVPCSVNIKRKYHYSILDIWMILNNWIFSFWPLPSDISGQQMNLLLMKSLDALENCCFDASLEYKYVGSISSLILGDWLFLCHKLCIQSLKYLSD